MEATDEPRARHGRGAAPEEPARVERGAEPGAAARAAEPWLLSQGRRQAWRRRQHGGQLATSEKLGDRRQAFRQRMLEQRNRDGHGVQPLISRARCRELEVPPRRRRTSDEGERQVTHRQSVKTRVSFPADIHTSAQVEAAD